MTGLPSLQEQARRLREAEAKGVQLNSVAKQIIAAAEAEKVELEGLAMRTAGRGKLVGALYILGGSLNLLARQFGIKTSTVWTYVRNNVPESVRRLASQQRDYGRSGELLSAEAVQEYQRIFQEQKTSLFQKNSVELAAALNTIKPKAELMASDRLEDATDEPY